MLRRLEWIKNCGIFEDYRWETALPELARINVIYGPNGSGKTSLAGALDGLRNAEDGEGYKRLSIALDDSGTQRVTAGQDDALFGRVHVFSEHYVGRSHKFTPAEVEMDAVLTIGEKSVDTEARLEALRETVKTKTADRDAAAASERRAKQAVDAAYGQVSQQVVDAASRAGGRWHSRSNFSAGMVRTAFANSHASWAALSEQDLRERISVINSDKSDPQPDDQLVVPALEDLAARLSTALSRTPSTIILDTLAAHPEATSWVDEGRHLHEGIDVCLFCGSPLTAERRALIDQHFSDEVERLQAGLGGIIRELTEMETGTSTALTSIPSRGLFFEDLRSRYDEAAKSLRDELTALRTWASAARVRAEAKAANVLATVEAGVDESPTVAGSELIKLRQEHNDRVSKHGSLVQAAAKVVELHYLKRAESGVKTNADLAGTDHVKVEKLNGELVEHAAEITTLEAVDGDPMPSAKVLTEEVARLLGRRELKFEAVDGRYRVTRDGQPAIGLSMGERTAITLIHFLESVAKFDESKGKAIVVIDDPVSSLDSDIFMGISTYIWAESVSKDHIAQVVLLTHNFELFRQWDVQIEGLPGRGGANSKYPSSLYEIRPTHVLVAGKSKRRPRLVAWPSTPEVRKKMRSTYQHAFMTVAQALQHLQADDSMEHKLDAQLLFPNVVRRMLETFLAFKHPEWVGNFTEAMRKSKDLLEAGGYKGDADALRLRLTRYSHAHSHSETPSTDITVSPHEVATAIGAAFEFMNCLDPAHFTGLCEVVGIDPSALLPPVPAEDAEEKAVELVLEEAELLAAGFIGLT
ncbi:AAA family ATPase [Cryobacterium sp. GrIS_2_6]|uniref:AAA family ATPase n=1 Tax=Cryobacterium sp. GrIS_2_6 TaxID=3162785 RepID=UPI002DFF150B|nr:wobble nucleotide-excising tRNase [Cryobacterium psychrotolerans]